MDPNTTILSQRRTASQTSLICISKNKDTNELIYKTAIDPEDRENNYSYQRRKGGREN